MFHHIGRKIMLLAKIMCWVGIVCSVLLGAAVIAVNIAGVKTPAAVTTPPGAEVMSEEMPAFWSAENLAGLSRGAAIGVGAGVIVLGSLASWVSSWVLYAFGELTDNVRRLTHRE